MGKSVYRSSEILLVTNQSVYQLDEPLLQSTPIEDTTLLSLESQSQSLQDSRKIA